MSQSANLHHNQVVLMPDKKVFLITEQNQVVYFDLNELEEEKERLEMSDFKTMLDGLEDDYQLSCVCQWHPFDFLLIVMSQSLTEKKFRFHAYDRHNEYVQTLDRKIDNMQTIIKLIQHQDHIYALDLEGNVGIHIGGTFNFTQVMQHCTDIFLTDQLYARQFSVDAEGSLVDTVVKRVGESNEAQESFEISKAIVHENSVPSFFSHSISVDGLMLLANGSTLYIRCDQKKEWLDCIMFGSLIVAIYPISGS